MTRMTERDRSEFKAYLRNCTDAQVQGVYDKESEAGRKAYATLASDEAEQRNLTLIR